jgi:hypothetical protein
MENLTSIPEGYSPLDFTEITQKETEDLSPHTTLEFFQLKSNFHIQDPTVAVVLNVSRRDHFMKYLSFCTKIIMEKKKTSFFPYISDPEFLLLFLNTFSFHIPAENTNLRKFYCHPNIFYKDLNDKERASCNINAINLTDQIITNPDNPYINFFDSKKTITNVTEESFFIDASDHDGL